MSCRTKDRSTSGLTTIPLELRHAIYDHIAETEHDINHDASTSHCYHNTITPLNIAQINSSTRAEFLNHLCSTITFDICLDFYPIPMPEPPFPYFYNWDGKSDNDSSSASRNWLERLGSEAPLKRIRFVLKNGIANDNMSHDWQARVDVHVKADGVEVTHEMQTLGYEGVDQSGRIVKVADAIRAKLEGVKQEREEVGWDSVKELITAINASQEDGKFVRCG